MKKFINKSKNDNTFSNNSKNIQLQNSQQNLNLNSTKSRNKNNFLFDTRKQNPRNAQWNAFKMKKVSNT